MSPHACTPLHVASKLRRPDRLTQHIESVAATGSAADPPDVIVLGVNAGVRVASELLTLTWAEVDFQRHQLTVQAGFAKADETRSVPLNSRAREVLLRRKAPSRIAFVFSKPNGLPYRSADKLLATACQAAGLGGTGISLHTLRHTLASRPVMSGADLRTVRSQGAGAT